MKSVFTRFKSESNQMMADWGYFARFVNPLNENANVLLVNGIHTAGVVGAAMAFGERQEAARNYEAVYASGVDARNFECYFRVQVLNGQAMLPAIDKANVLGLTEPRSADLPVSINVNGISSVGILFIGGDRGGMNAYQLQTAKEYHTIQDALRGGKYNKVVYLTSPIFEATRGRVANAYRESPVIVHFAGHGDGRTLSIIDDKGFIVSGIPMDGEQLCSLLETLGDTVSVCVLNSCESSGLAEFVVSKNAIEFAIGWPNKVNDSAAIAFSGAFYGALGHGCSLAESLRIGRVACGFSQEPKLFSRIGSIDTVPFVNGVQV